MSILLEYLGVDASVWNLRTGPVRMAPGAQGLGMLSLTSFVQDRGIRSGQRFSGSKANATNLILPMRKGFAYTTRTWDDVDAAWWKAARPNLPATLRVTASDGTQRTVGVRTIGDGPFQWDQDPSDVGQEDFEWDLVADDPWWRGSPASYAFGVAGTPNPFYGAGGYGPPFYLAAGNSNGTQQVVNPGDVDVWPVWTVTGPLSSVTITNADGSTVSYTPATALAAGDVLVIDETEDAKSAMLSRQGGAFGNVTPALSTANFRVIPAGASVSTAVAITGSGSATLALSPRYYRPYH